MKVYIGIIPSTVRLLGYTCRLQLWLVLIQISDQEMIKLIK